MSYLKTLIKSWRSVNRRTLRQQHTLRMVREITVHLTDLCEQINSDSAYVDPIKFQLTGSKVLPQNPGNERSERFVASNSFFSLLVRGSDGTIAVYILPAGTNVDVDPGASIKPKLSFRLEKDGTSLWQLDSCSISESEVLALVTGALRELVVRSQAQMNGLRGVSHTAQPITLSLTGVMRGMVAEKHFLMQKVVNQQEEIQGKIARDIHDAVIGNLMAVRRAVSGDANIPQSEVVGIIDVIAMSLREICHDLAPRDLYDLGLKLMLEELARTSSQRGCFTCEFVCNVDSIELPDEVVLHIYRIFQECFNNIEKYACATSVQMTIESADGKIKFELSDDGAGYDAQKSTFTQYCGSGMSIMKERCELINCFFPSELQTVSSPGKGTSIKLALQTN